MAGFVSELMVVFNRSGWSVWCLIHAVILVIANIYLFEGMGKNSLNGFLQKVAGNYQNLVID